MDITLYGSVPSKKNSKQIVRLKDGRTLLVPSKLHKAWHDEQTYFVRSWKNKLSPAKRASLPLEGAGIWMSFFPKDRRPADLTNKAESICDLLVDCGVIKDDNWFVLNSVHLDFAEVDKEKPRVEITIVPRPYGATS